ncbi:hypothetical protein GQR58_022038 [Nymphon striatum]|nr:hypothetical protein GQR58_022038 [Nymphon striatum]
MALLYKGSLYARNNENDEWRFASTVSQFRLSLGDTELQSNAFSISPNKNRYWKLKLDSEAQFTEEQLPEIRAGWAPRKLLQKQWQGLLPGNKLEADYVLVSAIARNAANGLYGENSNSKGNTSPHNCSPSIHFQQANQERIWA